MTLWLLLFGAFLVQEPISSNVILFEAYGAHYNIWMIHVIFVVATTIDILVGYYLARYLKRRFGQSKFVAWLDKKSKSFSGVEGKWGDRAVLLLATFLIFPVSILLAPWLDISFAELFVISFIGELLSWYIPLWLLVLGIKDAMSGEQNAVIIFVILILLWLVVRYIQRKIKSV